MFIYAGFWRRFLAMIIDGFLIWLLCTLLIIPYFIYPLCLIVAAYYHVVFETSALKATPGKSLLRIAVVDLNGDTLSMKSSLIRFGSSFFSSALICFGYLLSLFTEKRQTLHDFIAGTIVVEGSFGDANFLKIFIEQSKVIFGSDRSSPQNEKSFESQTLEELYRLYQKGILTEEEYNKKKTEYLSRL